MEIRRHSFEGLEMILNLDHPNTRASVSDHCLVLQGLGFYVAAEEMSGPIGRGEGAGSGAAHRASNTLREARNGLGVTVGNGASWTFCVMLWALPKALWALPRCTLQNCYFSCMVFLLQ
jgi:hypothetical protein